MAAHAQQLGQAAPPGRRSDAWVITAAVTVAGLGLVISGAVCHSANPLWRRDRFVVEGEFAGATCRLTLDGRDVTPGRRAPAGVGPTYEDDTVSVLDDFAMNVGLSEGQELTHVSCGGLGLTFTTAPGVALPPPGRYAVAPSDGPRSPATVRAALFTPAVTAGRWPFAWWGAYLDAYAGEVVLTGFPRAAGPGREGGARARVRFTARRVPGDP
jgi:hypothetical protein